MALVIRYWIVLGALAALTVYGGGYFVFHEIDLSFLQFATVLCASLLQAAVLAWRVKRPSRAVTTLAWSLLRQPLAQPVLVLDAVMLGGGIVWWDARVIGFGAAVNVQVTWTLVKAAAGGASLAGAVVRAKGRRLSIAAPAATAALLVFALEPSTSWLAAAFARVHRAWGDSGEVVQRLVFYGALFTLLAGLTLRSAHGVARRSADAGALLQMVVGAALVVAVTVVLASFNLPVVVQPYLGVAELASSLAATCLLLTGIVLATQTDGRTRETS